MVCHANWYDGKQNWLLERICGIEVKAVQGKYRGFAVLLSPAFALWTGVSEKGGSSEDCSCLIG